MDALSFRRFEPGTSRMIQNHFGIDEPAPGPGTDIPPRLLDLVLVPMVGFDQQGNRVGMGKGYYDRTFAGHARWWHRPLLVGLAHGLQQMKIDPRPWDVAMDYIATDSTLTATGSRR